MRGKFIVIYGANNLGKSTQAKLLIEQLIRDDIETIYIKYPVYNLQPTGPKINAVLRKGLRVTDLELQKLFAQNRRDFEQKLREYLEKGIWVVAEDYKGTGIAWGMVKGLDLKTLEEVNKGLLEEDLALVLFGERFKESVERGHIYEEDEKIWQTAEEKHLELAEKYRWEKVQANQTKDEVRNRIWTIVKEKLLHE